MERRMPLARYFFYVGGVLLALLFIADAYLPKFSVAHEADEVFYNVRIHSDRKWPERIVYDTSLPTIVPSSIASVESVIQAPEKIADASFGAQERETSAVLPSSVDRLRASNAKMQEPKPRHYRKVARRRVSAPSFAMARHPQFGWFGGNFW